MKEGVGDEIREASEWGGKEREAFNPYCHETNAFLLSLHSGAPLEFNAKMIKAIWNCSLTPFLAQILEDLKKISAPPPQLWWHGLL